MNENTVVDADTGSPSLEASATKLQQSCDEMTDSLAALSASMSDLAAGFAKVSRSTNGITETASDSGPTPSATRTGGFAPADD